MADLILKMGECENDNNRKTLINTHPWHMCEQENVGLDESHIAFGR